MTDSNEARIKTELDTITRRINVIMKNIGEFLLEEQRNTPPTEPKPEDADPHKIESLNQP